MLKRSLAHCFLVSTICLTTASCGGGGGGNPNSDTSATPSSVSSAYDGTYVELCDTHTDYSLQTTLTILNGAVNFKTAYFNNIQCSGPSAATVSFPQARLTLQDTIALSGLQGQKVTSSSAGGLVTYTGVAYDDHTGRIVIPVGASGTWVDSSDAASTYKDVLALNTGKLYDGDANASKDADGYPSALDLVHYFVKQ